MIINSWNHFLEKIPSEKSDIYFTEEYHILNSSEYQKPQAFIYQENSDILIFPFLSQELTLWNGETAKDFETAYGYGGPISNSAEKDFLARSFTYFKSELEAEGYIAGFIRFHPLYNNYVEFERIGELIFNRKTIGVNLDQDTSEIWNNEIHSKNRNVIKKGIKAGLTFKADYDFGTLPNFQNLYKKTMDKVNAESFYYFDDNYFLHLKKLIPESFIGNVYYQDKIISSAIFLYHGNKGHYHLSGSDSKFLSLAPNNFLLWSAMLELKSIGVNYFHLGGGSDSDENNSLFNFKKKFSNTTNNFYIGKLIIDKIRYEKQCKYWTERNPDKILQYGKRLLKYRY